MSVRDTLGGHPFEIEKKEGNRVLRIFPKSATARHPNKATLILSLDDVDSSKLIKVLSQ